MKSVLLVLMLFASVPTMANNFGFYGELGSVQGEIAYGMSLTMGPLLIGGKSNFNRELDEREKAPSYANDNEYLNKVNETTFVYSLSFGLDVFKIMKKYENQSLFIGVTNSVKQVTEYRDSEVGYWYKVTKTDENKETALELRYSPPLSPDNKVRGLVGVNTIGEFTLGLGYRY